MMSIALHPRVAAVLAAIGLAFSGHSVAAQTTHQASGQPAHQAAPRGGTPPATPQAQSAASSLPPRAGGAWWKDETFTRDLGLTSDQSARIDGMFQSTLPQLRQGFDELDRREGKLSRLIQADTDEARVIKEIDRVEAARSELNKVRTLMHMHMRQALTPEQRARFAALFEKRQQEQQRQQTARRPGQIPDTQGLED